MEESQTVDKATRDSSTCHDKKGSQSWERNDRDKYKVTISDNNYLKKFFCTCRIPAQKSRNRNIKSRKGTQKKNLSAWSVNIKQKRSYSQKTHDNQTWKSWR